MLSGKHIYVHRETGTIQRMPADIYHSKAGRRMVKHGEIDGDMAMDMEYIYIIYIYVLYDIWRLMT